MRAYKFLLLLHNKIFNIILFSNKFMKTTIVLFLVLILSRRHCYQIQKKIKQYSTNKSNKLQFPIGSRATE